MSSERNEQNTDLTTEQADQIAGGRTPRDTWPLRLRIDETAEGDLNEVAGGRTQQDAWPARLKVDETSDSQLDGVAGGACGDDEISHNDINRMKINDEELG